ncbi:MAG: 4'-phosphopantetheinyl transferase superfamily protein [Bacteroidetes bacterium]|uniref:4'-phosphopantetheinyl transferase superfamily protein n=1 Tax=Candidatus Cryptobacteroides merdavium TaxID=2840769 RepID=A0A9D9EDQ1_9BACT|nr:4'-phosphopantetheinyl transferase superfamily protein [Candidatus Cryptobacteroides merdavium]
MGLYFRKTLDNKAEVSVWKITETEEELIQLSSVPSDEMEEISLIRNENMRKQRLAVRALLNEVFEDKVYLSHHDNGKPFLENCITNISITHTDRYVAIITHQEEDLGIDMESVDRDFSTVKEKALSEDEREDLDEDDRLNEQLALYWCAKEAIFKRMSQSKVDFAEQIRVKRFNPKDEGELDATFIHKDGYEEDFELSYITFDRHVLVWVVG